VISSQEKAQIVAHAALDVQAEDVVVIDVRPVSTISDYFVLCTAGSSRQIEAISEKVETALRQRGTRVAHIEGYATRTEGSNDLAPQWMLMDCSDVVVHILDGAARTFYQLERLWGDAPRLAIEACPPSAPK